MRAIARLGSSRHTGGLGASPRLGRLAYQDEARGFSPRPTPDQAGRVFRTASKPDDLRLDLGSQPVRFPSRGHDVSRSWAF